MAPLTLTSIFLTPDTVCICVAGEVDMATTNKLNQAIHGALSVPGLKQLIVAMPHVTFLDAAGIRTLVTGYDRAFERGVTFRVTQPMRLGVVPMGSADGLRWLHAGRVLVRGHAVPLIGSPSLEHTRVDLTAVPDAAVGDEVVIIGRQGDQEITPGEVAAHQGLSLHHIATTVGPRVTRVYRGRGQVLHSDI